jgi:hypothetical protein
VAEFFNRKEEVIDLKLTRHGRYLLSRGQLLPEYYAFFDDDIVYDAAYGPHSDEPQNDSVKRIREDTPRIKVQNIIGGVESDLSLILEPLQDNLSYGADGQLINLQGDLNKTSQATREKIHSLPQPLGKSKSNTIHMPAWDIRFPMAALSSSNVNYSGSNNELYSARIPQLSTQHEIQTYIEKEDISIFGLADEDVTIAGGPLAMAEASRTKIDPQILSDIFPSQTENQDNIDGAFVTGKEKYLFLEVSETNVDFTSENFDIEVFEVTQVSGSDEVLTQKYFFSRQEELGLNASETTIGNNFPSLDDSYVEYWFDVEVDKEIEPFIYCELGYSEVKKDIYAELEIDMTCPDIEKDLVYDDTVEEEPC